MAKSKCQDGRSEYRENMREKEKAVLVAGVVMEHG